MRHLLCAVILAALVGCIQGCAGVAERLADKCYAFGGKASVSYSEGAGRVDCR